MILNGFDVLWKKIWDFTLEWLESENHNHKNVIYASVVLTRLKANHANWDTYAWWTNIFIPFFSFEAVIRQRNSADFVWLPKYASRSWEMISQFILIVLLSYKKIAFSTPQSG